jgi:flagellar FlgN protein
MTSEWESELATFLNDLTSVQEELLTFLADKRQSLVAMDRSRLDELQATERQLIIRLQNCQRRRQELLAEAARESLPSASLRSLAGALPADARASLESHMAQASERARLLQHQSLANWVFVQRTLLHLTRLLEIIATGGRSEPTYGRGDSARSGGALVDQAA